MNAANLGAASSAIDLYVKVLLDYMILLAAIATVTMALLELGKAVFRVRLIFHRWAVVRWVGNPITLNELLILSVSGIDTAGALFDQPTDKMMGQVQSAASVAVDFPDLYPYFYDFLTQIPSSKAAAKETGGPATTGTETPDAQIWRNFASRVTPPPADEAANEEVIAATRARARIDHFITRKLDAFQTKTEYLWARANQFVSVVGAAIFIAILIHNSTTVLQMFFLAASGGMIAPFSKDVVMALSGLRTRRSS